MTESAHSPAEHPAPHRTQASPLSLLTAIAAGPTGWIAQLIIDYGLSSYACFPRDAPLRQSPPWQGEHLLLLAVNLACLLLPVLGLVTALKSWRRTRYEKAGGAGTLLEIGEGRTRFLASCGMMSCLGFGLAVLFNTASALAAPACWDIGS